jgi:hypothetical protein
MRPVCFVCCVTLFHFLAKFNHVLSVPLHSTSAHPLDRGQLTRNAVSHQTLASSRVPLLSVTVGHRDPTRPVLLKARNRIHLGRLCCRDLLSLRM